MSEPGDVVTLDWEVRVDNVLTDAAVTLTLTLPDGTDDTLSVVNDDTGIYHADVLLTQWGRHTYRWVATGNATASQTGWFPAGMVSVEDIKTRLDKTLTVDDAEIADMLNAALTEYAEYVGPLPGQVTETLSGGGTTVVLRAMNPASILTAAYSDGTTITVDDLDLDTSTGILGWGYSTAGRFTAGRRNLTVTYLVGDIPANHKEAIAADVAGYFEMTQDGPAGPDDGDATGNRSTPLVLFPRIRSLAMPGVA